MQNDELWPITQVAEYWGVSQSRARAILADHGVTVQSGYPAAAVTAIPRPGAGFRTDLHGRPAGTV